MHLLHGVCGCCRQVAFSAAMRFDDLYAVGYCDTGDSPEERLFQLMQCIWLVR